MGHVPVKQMEQTGFWEVLAHVVTLSRNPYGRELRERIGRGKFPECIEPLWTAMKVLANNGSDDASEDEPEDDPPPARSRKRLPTKKKKRRPLQTHWRTDRALSEEPDFVAALELFKEELPECYRAERGKKQKSLSELQDFVQDILDKELEYEDLTTRQAGLLGVIRRMHAKYHEEELGDE